eukprot:6384422-Amphidinium_carterae.1
MSTDVDVMVLENHPGTNNIPIGSDSSDNSGGRHHSTNAATIPSGAAQILQFGKDTLRSRPIRHVTQQAEPLLFTRGISAYIMTGIMASCDAAEILTTSGMQPLYVLFPSRPHGGHQDDRAAKNAAPKKAGLK